MDASIVGINKVKKHSVKSKIIRVCWDNFLKKQITEVKPNRIIVIRYHSMDDSILPELEKTGIPMKLLPQPRGQAQKYYRKFRELVEDLEWEIKKTDSSATR